LKILAFNGSPRKTGNTATLLNQALEGAAAQGAETEVIHLYDLDYKGCRSCFACKLIGGKSYGQCAANDDLKPILKKTEDADAIILGTPIYLGTVSGMMKSFMERLLFPYLVYDQSYSTLFKKKIPTGFIYTMGANEERMKMMGYDQPTKFNKMFLERIFGEKSHSLIVTDTYQFDDYSKYMATAFNEADKAKRRAEEFPNDCSRAFEMGSRLVAEQSLGS